MKKLSFLIPILLISFCGFSQSLTGLWIGSLTNDSSTLRRDQSFEMALTEYRGKVYGYSHTTFMVHDTLFYIVKRVKGSIDGALCEVKDDELISCNFMTKQDKGVKQIYTFRLNTTDSIWRLDGEWKTNKTKKFYSISGSVKTATEKDLSKSKLFPHLQELNLASDVAAALPPTKKEQEPVKKQPEPKEPVVAKAEPKPVRSESGKKTENPPVKTETVIATPQQDITKTNTAKEIKKEQTQPKTEPPVISQTEVAKSKAETEKKKEDVSTKKETVPVISNPPVKTTPKNDLPAKPVAAVNVERRKSETLQTVNFINDSLMLSLYDNGEIDGDTISVLINGEIIMANQGLKASRLKKLFTLRLR